MNILGLHSGVDIVEIDRIKNSFLRCGDAFRDKIFTQNEILYCEERKGGKYQSYAARFAAKEAVSKALGTGIGRGLGLKDIEVLNNAAGRPEVVLNGKARELYDEMCGKDLSISLSHCKTYAVAYCILQTD